MDYIYDIVLNFNKNYYNFFEWSKKDHYINIKKIPYICVDNNTYKTFKYDNVTVDISFIDLIKDKTYTYSKKKIGPSILITNKKEVMALLFNLKGNLIKRSSLLIDEEEEVLDEIDNNKIYKINIVKQRKGEIRKINRSLKEKKDYLSKYINNENNENNLKYLYYDYFEEEESDIKKIKKILLKEINNNFSNRFNDLYETAKMLSKIKNGS